MRYLGASVAVLVAAMTFSLTTLGQAARASEDKPAVGSLLDRNAIVAPSASSSTTIPYNIERYMNPPKRLAGLVEYNTATCTEISAGTWTPTSNQACGKDASGNVLKCGKITRATITSQLPSGLCAGKTFTIAAIYYEWTAHNNQSNLSAPPNSVADTFDATWTTPDGMFTQAFTFNINVPVVRPDHETTVFMDWWPDFPSVGEWQQTLVPPSSDPTFDFSGESVQEAPALGVAGEDSCWFRKSRIPINLSISGGIWLVKSGNVWGPDQVGWVPDAVTYYRTPTPPPPPDPPIPPPSPGPCGYFVQQQMTIKAPSDGVTYNKYGAVNVLRGYMTQTLVTSQRAGSGETQFRPIH